jgi:hypothetical protein
MTEKTIDLTPTWREILPALLAIYEGGDRQVALAEFAQMAELADERVADLTSRVDGHRFVELTQPVETK